MSTERPANRRDFPIAGTLAAIAAFSFVIGSMFQSSSILTASSVAFLLFAAALVTTRLAKRFKLPQGYGWKAWYDAATVRRPIP